MTKLTLDDISNIENQGSAVSTINNNSALIEAAIENTVSRNGATPNMMTASIDMNSNRIINLPTTVPTSDGDAVSLGQLNDVAVRFDVHQNLTPIQQQQARDNINVSSGGGGGGGGGSELITSVFNRLGDIQAITGDYTVDQVTGAAPLASPVFSGIPTAPTAPVGDNTTKVATTAFVLANVGAGAVPSVFGRTGTVTAANGDYSAGQITNVPTGGIGGLTVQSALNELDTEKANLTSPTFVTSAMAPTPSLGSNNTNIATTAFVTTAITALTDAPQGRLTLQIGTPVMSTTQAAKNTIFYTPYMGNRVPIYDGTNIVMSTFSELSTPTSDISKNPSAIGISKVNDWFVWNDAGTLRLSHDIDWTTDITRAAGRAPQMINGILTNSLAITNGPGANRGTYVGTTRSNASSLLDWIYGGVAAQGLAGFIGVWNMYHRRNVAMFVGDSTDNWTYATAAWRPANNSNTMRISFVNGQPEDSFSARYKGSFNASAAVGIGYDVTNTFFGSTGWLNPPSASALQATAEYGIIPVAGFHFVNAIEYSNNVTTTFYGDAAVPTWIQTGMYFNWIC